MGRLSTTECTYLPTYLPTYLENLPERSLQFITFTEGASPHQPWQFETHRGLVRQPQKSYRTVVLHFPQFMLCLQMARFSVMLG